MNFDIEPYDPCPCGSGKKYKFCCAAKAKEIRHGKYPIGTVVYYGPDDKITTKIAAGVIVREGVEPVLKRWIATDILADTKIAEEVKQFFAKQGVKSVVVSEGNLGCPHEEGIDFPNGQDCPLCPFWAGKQGTARRKSADDDLLPILPDDLLLTDEDDGDEEDFEDDENDFDEDEENDEPEEDRDWDAILARVEAILGDSEDDPSHLLFAHLKTNLSLPCEVSGSEDFQWEEPYVMGGWSPREYKKLKLTQPSYTDRFELLSIDPDAYSEWMLFSEDIGARVRRISDGKLFILGLAELEATDKTSPNHQLLDDYAVWFVNNR